MPLSYLIISHESVMRDEIELQSRRLNDTEVVENYGMINDHAGENNRKLLLTNDMQQDPSVGE